MQVWRGLGLVDNYWKKGLIILSVKSYELTQFGQIINCWAFAVSTDHAKRVC